MRNTLSYQQSTYENDKIKSAQMAVDTSLNERVLDVDTMNATVESETALVPFQQNTPVRFLRGGSQYALWYLAQITRVAPKLWALSMTSSLGRLTQMPHKGGIYNGVAASAIIDDICGVVPHFVGAAFQNVLLYGWLPYVAPSGENGAQTGSAKDNLLKVLFALNATVRDDADGTLRIENLSTAVSAQLDADRIYRDNASVVTEPTVTAVTVLEHQYITGSETTTLFEGTTVDGQVIVFREPMSNLTATGFTVTESNANYAVVSAGSGTLTGTPYIHTTREITKPVTAAAIPNAVRIEDATLVGVTNSSEVVNRLVDYYSHRTYINVDATIDFEDAGDVVEIYDPFDKVLRQACIEKISPLVVSQTMKGRVSALVGFTPWQVVPFEDVRELLTGSGTWTVPEGVTEVTAVLIGAGEDGTDGSPGTAPSGSWGNTFTRNGSVVIPTTGTSVSVNGSASSSGGGAGVGGAGGAGGAGGKIFRSEIKIEYGQSFPFSCGDKDNDVNSVFGELSSANGASNPSGFFDSVTQTFYGVSGKAGLSGGNGGAAGSSGQDSGSVKGGSGVSQSSGTKSSTSWIGNKTEIKLSASCTVGGVGGGGAGGSAGNNLGEQGANAGSTYTWTATTSAQDQGGYYNEYGSGRAQIRNVTSGKGGNGANGSNGATYGSGGDGGGGGGGAGACGSASLQATLNGIGHWWSTAEGYETYLNIYLSGIALSSSSGGAGTGGSGGAGAPGCIILYYRRPVTE